MADRPIILTEGLTRDFGEVHALRGIDLQVERGTVLGMLGPNGAGKTTAVRILTTLLQPELGARRGRRPRRRARRRGAAVPYRPGRSERRRRREPHRPREPRDGRPPVPPAEGRGAAAWRRGARALRALRRRRPGHQDLLGRHAPPARPRGQPRRASRRALPRRAHDRARPAQPDRRLGVHPRAAAGRHDPAAHDPVPRGGRPARRPDRRDRPRHRDRRGHLGRAEGSDRRRGARAPRRGPRRDRPGGRRRSRASAPASPSSTPTVGACGSPWATPARPCCSRASADSTSRRSCSRTSRCTGRRSTTSSSRSPGAPPKTARSTRARQSAREEAPRPKGERVMSAVVQQAPVRRGPANTAGADPARGPGRTRRRAAQPRLTLRASRPSSSSSWCSRSCSCCCSGSSTRTSSRAWDGLDYVQFLMPGHLRAERDLRADHHGGRPGRRPEEGHHRPVPVAADGAVGRARGPDDVRPREELPARADRDGDRLPRGVPVHAGVVPAVGLVVLVLAVGFVFSWICACIGLALKEVEAVQAAVFTLVFPVVFVSSAFVPGRGHGVVPPADRPREPGHGLVQPRAVPRERQPRHPRRRHESARRHLRGLLFKSAVWIVGLLIVFVPLAIRLYRKLD